MRLTVPAHPSSTATGRRIRRLLSALWMVSSLALPVVGAAALRGVFLPTYDPDPTVHVVRQGETLLEIAYRYGVTVDQLVRANGLTSPSRIYVGQRIVIPRPGPGEDMQVHSVQAGESLAMIALRYGVTVEQIISTNNLPDRNQIAAGQELVIPGTLDRYSSTEDDTEYVVQPGDSLHRISVLFGISVDDLIAANRLPGAGGIYPGLALRIPSGALTPLTDGESAGTASAQPDIYTVRPGDTLATIALRHDVTVDGLVVANGLDGSRRIFAGQSLRIPESGAAARPEPQQTATSHRVQEGETLAEIALKYAVTVHALAAANGIRNLARIAPGTVLSIPSALAGTNSVRYATTGSGLCEDTEIEVEQVGSGYFAQPLRGYQFTQKFHQFHPGVDLAADIGDPVYAADSGVVVFDGWNPYGYGNLLVLDHGNGWRTYYGHLSRIVAGCGDRVSRGEIIAEVGNTGNSTGPHLHFEILRFGIAVNPEGYLKFR